VTPAALAEAGVTIGGDLVDAVLAGERFLRSFAQFPSLFLLGRSARSKFFPQRKSSNRPSPTKGANSDQSSLQVEAEISCGVETGSLEDQQYGQATGRTEFLANERVSGIQQLRNLLTTAAPNDLSATGQLPPPPPPQPPQPPQQRPPMLDGLAFGDIVNAKTNPGSTRYASRSCSRTGSASF
jgi:hypothetical protein